MRGNTLTLLYTAPISKVYLGDLKKYVEQMKDYILRFQKPNVSTAVQYKIVFNTSVENWT